MKIYLAPMEGITGYVYRTALEHHFPGVARYFTPFISAQKNLNKKQDRDLDPANNPGMELIPQFMATKADDVIDMQHLLAEKYGYREINLNLGCPSGTVVSKGHGSGFLKTPDAVEAFFDELFEKADFPISVKTRLGVESVEEWEPILSIYKKYPFSELIIHPRLTKDFYKGKPRMEAFDHAVAVFSEKSVGTNAGSNVRSDVPLCYNGDINTLSDYKRICSAYPELNRIMIGRGFLKNPVLINEILEDRKESDGTCRFWTKEDWNAVYAMMCEIRDEDMKIMSGDAHVLAHLKELWTHLSYALPDREKDLKHLKKSRTLTEYSLIVDNLLKTS